jgi:hypothetical protein
LIEITFPMYASALCNVHQRTCNMPSRLID